MQVDGWKYYNHAAITTLAPHETPDTAPIEDGSIWKIEGSPLLARWTTDFDSSDETNWWYIIKETPFDINALKAKRRYEINKGIKNFEVKEFEPKEYAEELYAVQVAAFSAYPKKYRPTVNKENFLSSVQAWNSYVCIGAFERESGRLCGYALLSKKSETYVAFNVMKSNPECEKNGVNAALVEGVLRYFNHFLENGGYICDGERSINHETAFQNYLEKYFGFRKAYCKLHITYNPKINWLVKLLYPIRKLMMKFDGISKVHQLNAVLRMEEIVRQDNG